MNHARVRLFGVAALTALAVAGAPASADAQEPPDSVVVGDSLAAPDALVADSLAADSLAVSDSLSADTIFYNMPRPAEELPGGYATGVWVWDRHAIMANGANTLAELLRTVPGLTTLLGGDYGTPASVSAFGAAGGGYRVLRDGMEVYAAEGSVPDLQLVGLGGISRVRLDRSMAGLVIELTSHQYDDGRPFSIVEAGTGDLDTNMFRGVYADPTALGGSVAVALERIDTRGRARDRAEGGNRTGSWVRYQFHLRDRLALGIDYRRMTAQTRVERYVPTDGRTDVALRGGLRVTDGITLNLLAGRTSFDVESTVDSLRLLGGSRTQMAATLGVARGPVWLRAGLRSFEGQVPGRRIEGAAGARAGRWGGAGFRYEASRWNETDVTRLGARVWASPMPAVTMFAAADQGETGGRPGPLREGPGPPPLDPERPFTPADAMITDRTTGRAGLLLEGWGVQLGGAAFYAWSDSVRPLGLLLDDGAPAVAGAHRNGYEGWASLPTGWEGMRLQGSYVEWDEEGPYLPRRSYQASFEFNRVYKETGNLEFWGSLGVRGHDPMLVFVADDGTGVGGLARVPFFQSWHAQIQVRVVSVRLWLGMDNITFRRSLQDFPGRTQPFGRSFFALRWDLWN